MDGKKLKKIVSMMVILSIAAVTFINVSAVDSSSPSSPETVSIARSLMVKAITADPELAQVNQVAAAPIAAPTAAPTAAPSASVVVVPSTNSTEVQKSISAVVPPNSTPAAQQNISAVVPKSSVPVTRSNTGSVIMPVPSPVPGEVALNDQGLNSLIKLLVERRINQIGEQIHKENKSWTLSAITNAKVDFNTGEASFKAIFKSKNGWKLSQTNAYMKFDILVNNNFSQIGIRFKGIEKIKLSNPSLDVNKAVLNFEKDVNSTMNGQCYWFRGDIPQTFKVFTTANLQEFLISKK